MSIEEQIKKLALDEGADLVGICLADNIKNKEFSDPNFLLPGAKSVISIAIGFDNEIVKNFKFHTTTEKVDSLLHFVLTVDSLAQILISTAGENAFDYGEIEGKRARLSITPSGNLRGITGIDSIPQGRLPGMNIQSSAEKPLQANLPERIFETEKEAILEALNSYQWNRSLAAQSLGIGRSTLWRKIKRYGLAHRNR